VLQREAIDHEILVVDDASTDGTANVAKGFDWVDYVRLPDNRGFSTATNVGIRRGSAPYVLLLNLGVLGLASFRAGRRRVDVRSLEASELLASTT
jgi:hypothetical protein